MKLPRRILDTATPYPLCRAYRGHASRIRSKRLPYPPWAATRPKAW